MALRTLIGLMCGMIAALIWGGGAVVSRHLVTHKLDPLDLALLRYAGCFPVAVMASAYFGARARLSVSWGQLAVLMMLAGPPYQLLIITGYVHATAGTGTLLVSGLLPVFSVLIPLLSSNALPSLAVSIGTALAVVGLAVYSVSPQGVAITAEGMFVFTLAAMLWASLNHLIRAWRIDPLRLTVALALWSPLFLPLYIPVHPGGPASMALHDTLLQLVYHGLLVAFAATLLFFTAVRLTGLVTSSVLQSLAPCFSAALASALIGEHPSNQQLAGLVITTSGVMLTAVASAVGTSARRPVIEE